MSSRNTWKRISDQFAVSIGGITIAIIAAFLTFAFSQCLENQKDKKNYEGLLYVIHIEMVWQNNHFNLLRNTLDQIENASIDRHSFIIEDSPMQFNTAMLEASLTKIIEYKRFNYKLVVLLDSYLNQVRDINNYLDFKNVNVILGQYKTPKDIDNQITGYFDVLNDEYINKTQPIIKDIRIIIEDELDSYPKDKMLLREKK